MSVTDLVRTHGGPTVSAIRSTSPSVAGAGTQSWTATYRVALIVGDAIAAICVTGLVDPARVGLTLNSEKYGPPR